MTASQQLLLWLESVVKTRRVLEKQRATNVVTLPLNYNVGCKEREDGERLLQF